MYASFGSHSMAIMTGRGPAFRLFVVVRTATGSAGCDNRVANVTGTFAGGLTSSMLAWGIVGIIVSGRAVADGGEGIEVIGWSIRLHATLPD